MTTDQRLTYGAVARAATPWIIILLFAAVGYRSVQPPPPQPADAPSIDFSAERAFDHVSVIAAEPHPMGSEANAEVRAYIVGELEHLGVAVELQQTSARDYWGDSMVPVVNVIGHIPGADSTGSIALVAHYDTVPETAGANDNSAAVAALLETTRALRSGPELLNDVVLLFTDAEEPAPKFGTVAFVTGHAAFDAISLVVNLEANGGSGASILAETSGPERWLIDALRSADGNPAAFSFVTEMTRLIGEIGTDFDVFSDAGVPGFNFAYQRGSPIYHTPADDIDSVSWGSLQHHGNHTLAIAQHFGNVDFGESRSDETSVFFSVRPFFISYPTGWTVPLAIVALVLAGAAIARRSTPPRSDVASLARCTAIVVGVGLLATIVGTLLWMGVATSRPSMGVLESHAYLLLIVAGITTAAAKAIARARASDSRVAILLWIALALLTALILPGFSYLFVWPVIVAAIAHLAGSSSNRGRVVGFAAVVAVTLAVNIPAIDVFFQFSQPRPGNLDSSIPSTVAAALLVVLLCIGLINTVWPHHGQAADLESRVATSNVSRT